MLGSTPRTVRFVYAVFETETQLANEHRDAITKALAKHSKTRKWKIGSDMFVGDNLGLSDAMEEVSRNIDSSSHYVFLTDGEDLTSGMQRMLREWPRKTSRSMVVFINDDALVVGNRTRNKLYNMAAAGYALGTVAARDAARTKLRPEDLEAIINHLLGK